MHVLELGASTPRDRLPIVLVHGASGNSRIRLASATGWRRTAASSMVDRPGHGWSDRPGGVADARRHGRRIDRAGARGASASSASSSLAIRWEDGRIRPRAAFPAGSRACLLAPVTHPWEGGLACTTPSFRHPLSAAVAHTVALPSASSCSTAASRRCSSPAAPADYVRRAAIRLRCGRPNPGHAQDVAALKAFVAAQAPRYGEIGAPPSS